jgi:hypothetical protein
MFTTAHHCPGREPANPFNILTPNSKWPLGFKLLDERDLQSLHFPEALYTLYDMYDIYNMYNMYKYVPSKIVFSF